MSEEDWLEQIEDAMRNEPRLPPALYPTVRATLRAYADPNPAEAEVGRLRAGLSALRALAACPTITLPQLVAAIGAFPLTPEGD